jgi:hypothetical protein
MFLYHENTDFEKSALPITMKKKKTKMNSEGKYQKLQELYPEYKKEEVTEVSKVFLTRVFDTNKCNF